MRHRRISTAAVGLAALFRAAPLLFDTVRLLGAAFLLLLGIRAFRHRNQGVGEGDQLNLTAGSIYLGLGAKLALQR